MQENYAILTCDYLPETQILNNSFKLGGKKFKVSWGQNVYQTFKSIKPTVMLIFSIIIL